MRRELWFALATVVSMASLVPITVVRGQESQQVPIGEYGARRERVTERLSDGILLVPSRFEIKADALRSAFTDSDPRTTPAHSGGRRSGAVSSRGRGGAVILALDDGRSECRHSGDVGVLW